MFSLLTILYMLTVLAVLVSMIVQVKVVRRMRIALHHLMDTWRHITTIIFLLASIFFDCNVALTADIIFVQVLYFQADKNYDHSSAEFRVFSTDGVGKLSFYTGNTVQSEERHFGRDREQYSGNLIKRQRPIFSTNMA